MKINQGFTLVEVLICVMLLSTGLLGLAGLQATGLKNNVSAYNRTQATQLAYDIAERMRTNIKEAEKGSASKYIQALPSSLPLTAVPTFPLEKPNCKTTAGCSTTDMAENDLFEWINTLSNTFPGGVKASIICIANCISPPPVGTVCLSDPLAKVDDVTPCPTYTITISWDDNHNNVIDDRDSIDTTKSCFSTTTTNYTSALPGSLTVVALPYGSGSTVSSYDPCFRTSIQL